MKNDPTACLPNPIRRQLMLALPGGLVVASPLALVACGGGGDSGDTTEPPAGTDLSGAPVMTKEALAVKVVLPAGTPYATTALYVGSGTSVARIAADGSSGVVSLDGGASLAYLFSDTDKLVGMGFVGKDRPTIDARTTAEALVYLGCSPSQLGEAFQFALRKVLATHTLVAPVVVAVEAAMKKGSIHHDDADLMSAVQNAVAVIRRRTAAMAMKGAGGDRLAKLTYDNTTHSGMKVIEQPGFNTIALENSFRRRAVATVERFGHTTATGEIKLETPTQVGNPFKVDPEEALNLSNVVNAAFERTLENLLVDIGIIGDYDLGSIPWTAKTSETFELPLVPADARETYYRVNVIGPGAMAPSRALTAAEQGTYEELLIGMLLKDLILPVASAFLLPIAGKFAADALKGRSTALLGLAMGLDVTRGAFAMSIFPKTDAALRAGHWGEALLAVSTELMGTAAGQELVKRTLANLASYVGGPALATIRDSAGRQVGVDLLSTEGQRLTRNFISGLERVTGWVAAIETVMLVADVGKQIENFAQARTLEDFRVDGSPAVIVITPDAKTLSPNGDSQRFEVTQVDGRPPEVNWLYEWKCASARGFIVVGAQTSSPALQTLIESPLTSTLYTVQGGNVGGEAEEITVRVYNARRQFMGTKTAKVTIDTPVQAALTPPSVEFKPAGANQQQLFALALTPPPVDATLLSYDWICPSQHGSLQSGGATTSVDMPKVTSGQANATYRLAAGSLGGETENISVEVFLRAVDAATGATSRRKIATTQAVAKVKSEFSLSISPPGPTDLPSDTSAMVIAIVKETLPASATVAWEWTHGGAGAIDSPVIDNVPSDSAVSFKSGASDGTATIGVRATITIPATATTAVRTVVTSAVSTTLKVKRGLRQIVMEVSGGVFGCNDPRACGVSEYTAFIVPKLAKATLYSAVLSGYAYPSCNRTVTWTSPKGDGGGCNFPVTYHPHTSMGPTNQWAVWLGFGGPFSGKCVVTITLAP